MRLVTTLFICLFSLVTSHTCKASQAVMVNVNILNGEAFVPFFADIEPFENQIAQSFNTVGYKVYKCEKTDSTFYVDAFMYQYNLSAITVKLIVRSSKGTHFYAESSLEKYSNRDAAFSICLKEVLKQLPPKIDTSIFYHLTISQLLHGGEAYKESIVGRMLEMKPESINFRLKGDSALLANLNNLVSVQDYFYESVSFSQLKPRYKSQVIALKINISDCGRLSIDEIVCNKPVSKTLRLRMEDVVYSLPFYTGTAFYDSFSIMFNVY